jgi:glycosyltransferase involved in cell wall biosynthesis
LTAPLSLLLWHLGRRGGGPRYHYELARSLKERDDVRLCLALSRQSELYDDTAALGIPTLAIDTYQSKAEFAAGLLRLPKVRRQLADFVRQHQAKAALCSMVHLWNPLLVGPIRRAGAINALVVHDAAPHPGDNYGVRNLMMRNDYRQSDLLVSLSDAVAKRLVEEQGVAPERIIASKMGPFRYSTGAVTPRKLGKPPFRLLFFGRLAPYKGLDLLIDAMRLLGDFPAELRIVGQGPLPLENLPANVRLERRWAPEQEIPSLFADCDLVVLPYQEASQSGVLPIAQHLAVPSLVTPVGGLLQQVEEGRLGFVTLGISANGVADAIRLIVSTPGRYDEMSQRLAAECSDRQWNLIAEQLVRDIGSRLEYL